MALVAEVFAFHVTHVAVRAVKFGAIVRRHMGVRRLHILRLGYKRIDGVAARAVRRRRFLEVGLVGAVADRTVKTERLVVVCNARRGSAGGECGKEKSRTDKGDRFHVDSDVRTADQDGPHNVLLDVTEGVTDSPPARMTC